MEKCTCTYMYPHCEEGKRLEAESMRAHTVWQQGPIEKLEENHRAYTDCLRAYAAHVKACSIKENKPMNNTVHPVATYHHAEADIVLIPMRPNRYSVGIVYPDSHQAIFPWDWDERFLNDAKSIASDLCRGHWGTLKDALASHAPAYTMPYPIQRT